VGEKHLVNPFFKVGSKKRKIEQYPDYLLQINKKTISVLDAKAPNQKCEDDGQVYGYAIHPEIRAKYFGMCNGRQFVLWNTTTSQQILNFNLQEIDHYWQDLKNILSPKNFNKPKSPLEGWQSQTDGVVSFKADFDYLSRPLPKEIPVKKQSAKRHFGVHGYFTKQAWNIVHHYIQHFTQPGDVVLDPFVGSGVTSIESGMLNRKGIGIDLNPLPIFIINSLITPTNISELYETF